MYLCVVTKDVRGAFDKKKLNGKLRKFLGATNNIAVRYVRYEVNDSLSRYWNAFVLVAFTPLNLKLVFLLSVTFANQTN